MEPIEIDDEELDFLPPHTAMVFAADQPQYLSLPAILLEGPEGRVITKWRLTADERESLAKGEDLYLEQLTFPKLRKGEEVRLQPIRPTVGLRTFCPMTRQ